MNNGLIGKVGSSDITVGRFTYGFDRVNIKQWGGGAALKIGNFCSIASATIFLDGNHTVDWITTFPFARIFDDHAFYADLGGLDGFDGVEPPSNNGDVVIGNDVWIGYEAMVLPGVLAASAVEQWGVKVKHYGWPLVGGIVVIGAVAWAIYHWRKVRQGATANDIAK